MTTRKIGGLLAGLAATALVGHGGAARADADSVFTFSNDLSGSEVVGLVDASGNAFGVYAGRYRAQIGPAAGQGPLTNIFCVDFTHEIHLGDTYAADTQNLLTAPAAPQATNGYYNGGLASALTAGDYAPAGAMTAAQRASEVAFLADNYLNATATTFTSGGQVTFTQGMAGSADLNNNLAAVSLSIWDIMQDGGTGLDTGSVRLQNPAGTSYASLYNYPLLQSLSGYYEQQAAGNANYQSGTAYWIQAPVGPNGGHFQDYVAAVPEPSAVLPMLLGVGGLSALAVARRRKARA